jgi:hypothetical protein
VLNVGAGGCYLNFKKKKKETSKQYAKRVKEDGRMVRDLLRQGYSVFAKDEDGKDVRVYDFYPDTLEYYLEPPKRVKSPKQIVAEDKRAKEKKVKLKADKKKTKKGKRISAKETTAVVIGPTAGG